MDSQWHRIQGNYFRYDVHGTTFLIKTLPFKIYELTEGYLSLDELDKALELIRLDDSSSDQTVAPQTYYLPLVIVTNACNLACSYCYAWQGSYGMGLSMISPEVIDRTLELTQQHLLRLGGKERVDFGLILFGGEPSLCMPILQYSLRKVLEVADRLSSMNFPVQYHPIVTVNTNAYALSQEFFDLVQNYRESLELVVSYDGLWHDENRKDRHGICSARQVEANIARLVDLGVHPDITMVVPPSKMAVFEENVQYIAAKFGTDIGINPSFVRGAIPAVSRSAVYPGILEHSYESETVFRWSQVTRRLILDGYNIYWKRFVRRIHEGGYRYRCPAMLYEFCVTPSGDVYPCHNFTEESFRLGNILDDHFSMFQRKDILNMFLDRTSERLQPCQDCLFQTICLSSFDCPAHSLHDLGDFSKVDDRFCQAAQQVMDGLLQRFIRDLRVADVTA